ncbi:insulinase family protein [Phaeobacter italicus]|jgi:zinc protease|uniref:Peptidase M16 inactive domain protein n=2 Tax=Phaeobacter italicus TaxID=481446 RepID=A0A0H5D652_9RHOB|nr:pitrilysin family protein [Phaeobacter italicus]MBO9443451.1 insulinase family protein [Phaeobacter italicus]MEE2816439.1 pitrilysin family protein [Pseudomonadota bacterium]CRL12586.1 Peptidase M16 inactive domain protein [Phaeobacter italicus]
MKALKFISAALALCFLALPVWAEVKIKEVVSPGGITAWLVEDHSIPFTALELRFRGGTSLDQPGKRGATYLMAGLLEEGAGGLAAQDYARELESLAARFSYDADRDTVSISAQFLSENRAEAVDLLRLTIHEPRFDQDALDRVRAQVLAGLRSDEKDPNEIASRAFSKMAFGDHPYGSEGEGTIDSVSALTRQDMFDAHEAAFARDRLFVGAVGDITAEELGALLDELLGDLPATGAPIPGPAEVAIDGGVTVIDYDTPQSVALFGHVGIDLDDPRYFAAYLLNQVLGGGSFNSRLMTEVREKRGLTYGVYSYLVPRDLAAVYMGSVASDNSKIAETVEVIQTEWARLATEGVSEKELADAKTYLTGAYPLRFDGNSRIASILAGMQMDDLPIDYVVTRNDKVNAVTLEEVNRVAREILLPEKLHFVVVGRPEGLQSTN